MAREGRQRQERKDGRGGMDSFRAAIVDVQRAAEAHIHYQALPGRMENAGVCVRGPEMDESRSAIERNARVPRD
jgi:hypothetical protein